VEKELRPDELRQHLVSQGFGDVHIAPVTPTVEDCFMALTR